MQNISILEQTFGIRDFPFERLDGAQFNDKRLVPLGLGNKCVCLEPKDMREKMCELSADIYYFYHSNQ